jgi:hypothetical protein
MGHVIRITPLGSAVSVSIASWAPSASTSIAEIARKFKTTRQTIMRVKEAALKLPSQQKE